MNKRKRTRERQGGNMENEREREREKERERDRETQCDQELLRPCFAPVDTCHELQILVIYEYMHLHTAYVHTSTIDDSDIHKHIYIRSWHSSWLMKLCLLHISVTYVRIFTYDMHICHELQTSVT